MNTIRSTWIGWGALCVAGGGAYYYAKKSVNADRATRHEAGMRRKAEMAAMEAEQKRVRESPVLLPPSASPKSPVNPTAPQRAGKPHIDSARDHVGSPSSESSQDPASTRHEPETETDRVLEKSKYEAAEPFRPPKGNRFS